MIPRTIHYCWFGGKEKPKEVQRFIESWKKNCPDFNIKEWNESNFNINCCKYVEEAYQQKKWAFVSDVARVYALHSEGGIYMDTDVEVLKPLNKLLDNKFFIGFEGTQWIGTNIIGSVPKHFILEKFLEDYKSRSFIKSNGELDQTTNVEKLTELLKSKYNIKFNGNEQEFIDLHLYPTEYFSPYDYIQGKLKTTSNTYTIHWFSQTWIKQNPIRKKLSHWYHRLVGTKMK